MPELAAWVEHVRPEWRSSPFPDELHARTEALLVPPPEHASGRIALK